MKLDALTHLILAVGDESPREHKAIFCLWSALDDIINARPVCVNPRTIAERGLRGAAHVLETT